MMTRILSFIFYISRMRKTSEEFNSENDRNFGSDNDKKVYSSELRAGNLYYRPPGFAVMPPGRYLAGGLQSGSAANLIGVQYNSDFHSIFTGIQFRKKGELYTVHYVTIT